MARWDENHTTIEQIQRDRAVTLGDVDLGRQRYNYYQEDPQGAKTLNRIALNHYQEESALNQAYFSQGNIDLVQAMIRKQVYERSGDAKWVIGNQDENELVIVMRSIFLQKSQNLPFNVTEQIAILNQIVADEVVPKVMSGITQYFGYLKDASTLYAETPLEHPQNVSSAGTKTYSFTNWF